MNYKERKFRNDFKIFFYCDFMDCVENAVAEIYLYLKENESLMFNVCPRHGKLISEKIQRGNDYEVNT